MTVQAGAVRRLLKPEQEREREALVSVEETGRKALTEMRRLLGVLKEEASPAPLAPQPGMRTLDTLLDQVREAGLPVELSTEGNPVELAPGVDLSAYRIIQEALTNALKHAGPARAWVVVRYGERRSRAPDRERRPERRQGGEQRPRARRHAGARGGVRWRAGERPAGRRRVRRARTAPDRNGGGMTIEARQDGERA